MPRPVWPGHEAPRHTGWRRWCALCRLLKLRVDAMTGRPTDWTASELRPRPGRVDEMKA